MDKICEKRCKVLSPEAIVLIKEATVMGRDEMKLFIIHIHTEKYSPKVISVNFHTQMRTSQSEERTLN